MSSSSNDVKTTHYWRVISVFLLALLLVPAITHSLLDHPPEYDELLHVLAARGIVDTGKPVIADGLYPRAQLYTELIARIAQPGDSELVSARIPSMIAAALLVALLGAWVATKVGWIAGMATAGVLAIMPDTAYLAVLIRFYTVHALLMAIMLICLFEALSPHRRPITVVALLIVALACLGTGLQLQQLSQVTFLAGLAATMCLIAHDRSAVLLAFVRTHWIGVTALFIALVLLALYLVEMLNIVERLRGITPAWSVNKANDLFFYSKNYTTRLPLLWPLFPVLIIFAFFQNRRIAIFFTVVVLVAFAISSIASQKAMRYVYHFAPAIAVLCGIGLHFAIRQLSELMATRLPMQRSTSLILGLILAGICLLNSVEVQRAIKMATGQGTVDRTVPVMSEPDWTLAQSDLSHYLDSATQVIVSSGVKSLYAFGRYDYELSRTVIDDTLSQEEFGYDARTGRRVISTAESVSNIISREGTALIVLENRMLNQSYSAPVDTVNAITQQCKPLQIAPDSQLSAWLCN